MIRAILAMAILALACGGGGSDPDPTDVCNDYCDRLSECGWVLVGYGDPCNTTLCQVMVEIREGDSDGCDEAMVEYFQCGKKASCSSLQGEPCPGQLQEVFDECASLPL